MFSPVARPAPRSKAGIRYQDAQRAALELFAERGFSRVGMRDPAAHMGIAAGSLYNHIESKEALLFEFIEEFYSAPDAGRRTTAQEPARRQELARALLERHLQLHQSMPLHFRLAEYELCCLPPEPLEQILELRERYEQHWLQAVRCCAARRQTLSVAARYGPSSRCSTSCRPGPRLPATSPPAACACSRRWSCALAGALGMAVHTF